MSRKEKILVVIPARGGSKRIPRKNIRIFYGKPLIAYTIEQARAFSAADRVIVDTDSEEIRQVALAYGAEAPFLRPLHLAGDRSHVVESIIHLLNRLQNEEHYAPDYVLLLQVTSPLRELAEIEACWELLKTSDADTALTVTPVHPQVYHVDDGKNLILINGTDDLNPSVINQAWPPVYILNGSVYLTRTAALLREKSVVTRKTKAIVCPKWHSVDLDEPEDWAAVELLYGMTNDETK